MVKFILDAAYEFLKKPRYPRKTRLPMEPFNQDNKPDKMESADVLLYLILLVIFISLGSWLFQQFWNRLLIIKLGNGQEIIFTEALIMYIAIHILF
jgi:hypothetical protein